MTLAPTPSTIANLPAVPSVGAADYVPISHSGTTYKATASDFAAIVSSQTIAATAPVTATSSGGTTTIAITNPLPVADGGTGAATASAARTALGLGTSSVENLGTVVVDDGSGNLTIGSGVVTGTMLSSTVAIPSGATATTQALANNSTKVATTAYVDRVTTPNTYNHVTATPTVTTSTAAVMLGLAGAITPATTGDIMVVIAGDMTNSVTGDGAQAIIAYGTGTAPVNGAAVAGTAVGNKALFTNITSGGDIMPFSCQAIVTGLTLSTAYWIDLQFNATAGGTATLSNVCVSIFEIK